MKGLHAIVWLPERKKTKSIRATLHIVGTLHYEGRWQEIVKADTSSF